MTEEHNMTLREKWSKWIYRRILDTTNTDDEIVFKWFITQFDAMLAEDIEKMNAQKIDIEKYRIDLIKFNRCNKSNRRLNVQEKRKWNEAIDKSLLILEARRLSLNK